MTKILIVFLLFAPLLVGQGTIAIATMSGVKGQTVSVPITLTSDVTSGVEFMVVLPLWANNKANFRVSQSGKTARCKWQKAGMTSISLKCTVGSLETLDNKIIPVGILGYLDIPIPTTLTGTVSIALTNAFGVNAIYMEMFQFVTVAGRLTVSSTVTTGGTASKSLPETRVTIPRSETEVLATLVGVVIKPQLGCEVVEEGLECQLLFDTADTEVMASVFSSNEEDIASTTLIFAPGVVNRFMLPFISPSHEGITIYVKVMDDVLLSWSWPPQ